MKHDFSGKTAVITGGSTGYGAGIAEVLSKSGASVWITGRHEETLKETAESCGCRYVAADAARPKDWDALIDRVTEKEGKIDLLVNNAGGGINIAPLEEQTDEEINASITVNLTGAIYGCRRVLPQMKKRKSGTIINVSSICATEAWPGWSVYAAAKAGMVQFTNSIYVEGREHGIRATSLVPSWGNTEFIDSAGLPAFDKETRDKCIQPAELGDVVAYIWDFPAHLELQSMVVLPLVQEINPF